MNRVCHVINRLTRAILRRDSVPVDHPRKHTHSSNASRRNVHDQSSPSRASTALTERKMGPQLRTRIVNKLSVPILTRFGLGTERKFHNSAVLFQDFLQKTLGTSFQVDFQLPVDTLVTDPHLGQNDTNMHRGK